MRILRGLRSRLLPCGCVAGVYETYDGTIVTIVDERGEQCAEAAHRTGEAIGELDRSDVSDNASRHR